MPSRGRPLLLGAALALAVSFAPAAEPQEIEKATRTILCDCGCHPQSVHECACGRAAEMRSEIAAAVRSGKTGEQVIDDYVARYGEKIRIAPTASGFNLVAWLGPGFGLLAGLLGLVFLIRRWRRTSSSEAATAPPPTPADDPYLARLEREVRDYR